MRYRENRNVDGRLLGKQELQSYLNMGRTGAERLAKAAGAVIKIGGRVLYDRAMIDEYLDRERNAQQYRGKFEEVDG